MFRLREKTPDTESVSKSGASIRSGRVEPTVRGLPVPANAAGASYLSPRLKARMDELGPARRRSCGRGRQRRGGPCDGRGF